MVTLKAGRRRVCWRLVAVTALFFSVACGSRQERHAYRIGLGPWVGFGPFYLAQEKGFFKNAGVDVDLTVLTGLAERNSALKSGRIDGLAAPVDYFVLSAGNNLVTDIVMAVDESNGGDGIVANDSIHTFTDLKGKRVAFQRGLPSEFFLRALLQKNGMHLSELNAVDMETAQAGAAFIAKKLDAAGLWEPWLTKAREEGAGHILASTREYRDLIVDVLAFNTKIVSEHPADIQKMVNCVLQAINYWKQHPQESDDIMAPHFQVSPAQYARVLSGANLCDLARNRAYFGTSQAPGPIFNVAKRASQIWREAGTIQQPVSPDSIVVTKFVKDAVE
jgi:NitT/TauT family transport system substrate-binding protein